MIPPMKSKFSLRQGDVLMLRVTEIPKDAKPAKREKGLIILARGEMTNHHHAITDKTAKSFLCGNDLYLDLSKRADVDHQEHGTVTLEPGIYKVVHQHEYRRKEIIRTAD
jgi:hypothetical protein